MKMVLVGIQSNAVLMASAMTAMSENIELVAKDFNNEMIELSLERYNSFRSIDVGDMNFNSFKCNENTKIKGSHPQPFYRKNRW